MSHRYVVILYCLSEAWNSAGISGCILHNMLTRLVCSRLRLVPDLRNASAVWRGDNYLYGPANVVELWVADPAHRIALDVFRLEDIHARHRNMTLDRSKQAQETVSLAVKMGNAPDDQKIH